jgi:nitrite reductase (NADH) large subunit
MKVVVIGNGIAGVNVASGLRADPSVEVAVYAAEPHAFYSRVRLPEVVSGASAPEAIQFYKEDWYVKKGITVHSGVPAVSINREKKTVTLADGSAVAWDSLVLATGASANRPAIPGADLPGVYALRTMDDALAIRANALAFPESASVVGGGLLGLEAARALKDAGVKNVRVFEIAPRLLPRQLDETGAALLSQRFAAMGIDVVCGAETASFAFADGSASRAGVINLKDGRSFPSDTTILSMGVHSNVALAKDAGLAVNRGIVVDNRLRTSDPAIYAVGDCAEFCGVVWGIIPAALEEAPVAAKSILASANLISADASPVYAQTVPKTALKVGDVELMSLGKAVLTPEETASGAFEVVSRVWEGEVGARYEKFVRAADGTLVGAIIYGSKAHQALIQRMTGKPATRAELEAILAE